MTGRTISSNGWRPKRTCRYPAPDARAASFPGGVFGNYVRHLLNQEIKGPAKSVSLELLRGDAQRIELSGDEVVLHLDRRRTIRTDLAVLAVGNFPPESPTLADSASYDTALCRSDPWAATDTFTDLDPDRPGALMIGTGLTMVDTAISLLDRGHRGRHSCAVAPRPMPAAPFAGGQGTDAARRVLPDRFGPVDGVHAPRRPPGCFGRG